MRNSIMKIYHWIWILLLAESASAKVVVTKEICDQIMIDAVPDADVNYKPDEDPDMPPADLGGSIQIKLPKKITIPVNVDLHKYMEGVRNPRGTSLDYGEVGEIVVHDDGRLYFNGQPLFHEDEYKIKQACR